MKGKIPSLRRVAAQSASVMVPMLALALSSDPASGGALPGADPKTRTASAPIAAASDGRLAIYVGDYHICLWLPCSRWTTCCRAYGPLM